MTVPGPWPVLGRAFARALAARRLVALGVALHLGALGIVLLPLSALLAPLLDRRPLAGRLYAGADDGAWAELLLDHRDLLPLGIGLVAAAVALEVVGAALLAPRAIAELSGGGEAPTRPPASSALALAGLLLPFRLAALAAGAAGWLLTRRLLADRGLAELGAAAAAAVAIGGAAWMTVSVVQALAVARLVRPAVPAPAPLRAAQRALGGSLAAAATRPRPACALALAWGLGLLGVTSLYHLAAAPVSGSGLAALGFLGMARLGLVTARAVLWLAAQAAAAELTWVEARRPAQLG